MNFSINSGYIYNLISIGTKTEGFFHLHCAIPQDSNFNYGLISRSRKSKLVSKSLTESGSNLMSHPLCALRASSGPIFDDKSARRLETSPVLLNGIRWRVSKTYSCWQSLAQLWSCRPCNWLTAHFRLLQSTLLRNYFRRSTQSGGWRHTLCLATSALCLHIEYSIYETRSKHILEKLQE